MKLSIDMMTRTGADEVSILTRYGIILNLLVNFLMHIRFKMLTHCPRLFSKLKSTTKQPWDYIPPSASSAKSGFTDFI